MMKTAKNMGLLMVAVLLLILVTMLGGCNNEPVEKEPIRQHLNYALSTVPLTLDPGNLQDEASFEFIKNIYEGLVRLKPDGTFENAMAETWEIEEQGKKHIFTIREASWTNGDKVTAYDFEYAIMRNLDPQNNCPYAYILYDIKNAEGYNRSMDNDYSGKKANKEDVGIEAIDEKTLVIKLQKPDPVFFKKLSHPAFYPLPQGIVISSATKLEEFFTPSNIIGNGSFKVVGKEQKGKYELVKNEKYWDCSQIKLESMNWYLPKENKNGWEMFNSEVVDLTKDIPLSEVAGGLKKGTLKSSPLLSSYFYQYNVAEKPLDDKRVRQALSYALSREKLVKEYLKSGQKPALGLIPSGMPDRANEKGFWQTSKVKLPDNNMKEGQRLLAEAGYPEGKDFPELELLISEDVGHKYLAEKICDKWESALGVKVKVVSLKWKELVQRIEDRDYDLVLMGWSADYADPTSFLKQYVKGKGNNYTGWVNSVYDEALKEAYASNEEEVRMNALHKAENVLLEELPVLPLYEYSSVYAMRKGVEGVYVSPLGDGIDFKWTYISN